MGPTIRTARARRPMRPLGACAGSSWAVCQPSGPVQGRGWGQKPDLGHIFGLLWATLGINAFPMALYSGGEPPPLVRFHISEWPQQTPRPEFQPPAAPFGPVLGCSEPVSQGAWSSRAFKN